LTNLLFGCIIVSSKEEREDNKMTDRERFIKRAKEMGATVLENKNNTMMVLSSNGAIVTMYTFTKDGKYADSVSHQYK